MYLKAPRVRFYFKANGNDPFLSSPRRMSRLGLYNRAGRKKCMRKYISMVGAFAFITRLAVCLPCLANGGYEFSYRARSCTCIPTVTPRTPGRWSAAECSPVPAMERGEGGRERRSGGGETRGYSTVSKRYEAQSAQSSYRPRKFSADTRTPACCWLS